MTPRPTVCFFAKLRDRSALERVEFYAQDLEALRRMGLEVHVATSLSQLRPADLYVVWWWTWAFAPIALAAALRRPVVVTGVFDAWAMPRRPASHRALMRWALRRADVNVFISQLEARDVPEEFEVRNPVWSPLCVDTERYSPGSEARDPDLLLTVGAMHAGNADRKGIPEFLDALALLRKRRPSVRGIVAGHQGSDFPAIRERARRLGLDGTVEFPGIISTADKVSLLRRCAAYVQPSRFEGFGLAVLEAMSCGAPVVARPAGAVPEVVGSAARLVVQEGAAALADALHEVLQHGAAALGRDARHRAETEFPLTRRHRDLAAVVAPLLAGRGLALPVGEPSVVSW